MFFVYYQNNSGGSYKTVLGNGVRYVIVEAKNANRADKQVVKVTNGEVYFDGVEKGIDCPCCGDRWSRAWDCVSEFDFDLSSPTWNAIVFYNDGTFNLCRY